MRIIYDILAFLIYLTDMIGINTWLQWHI